MPNDPNQHLRSIHDSIQTRIEQLKVFVENPPEDLVVYDGDLTDLVLLAAELTGTVAGLHASLQPQEPPNAD